VSATVSSCAEAEIARPVWGRGRGSPLLRTGDPLPLHTTTVRFDANTWAELSAEAERLGVPKATYIREATARRLAAAAVQAELAAIRRRLGLLERRLGWLMTLVVRRQRS
jgi:hypothetical protein